MNRNPLKFRYFSLIFGLLPLVGVARAAEVATAPYADYYQPAKGFNPAQRDFTKILLQLAGSLEHHGTPEPYIRHVMAEHVRIAARYRESTGKEYTALPEYLTTDFVEHLLGNWKKLTPGLKLDTLSRQSGRNMRLAIMGTWNMPATELAATEARLTSEEKKQLVQYLNKDFIRKADLPELERFYADGGPYDRLSSGTKLQIGKRIEWGIMPPEERKVSIKNDKGGSLAVKFLNSHQEALVEYLMTDSQKVVNGDTLQATLETGLKLDQDNITLDGMNEYERDALVYSHAIKADFIKRFIYLRETIQSKEEAESTVRAVYAMVDNLAVIANSELRGALIEERIK